MKVLSGITQDPVLFNRAASVINWLESIANIVSPIKKLKISSQMIESEVDKFVAEEKLHRLWQLPRNYIPGWDMTNEEAV